MKKLLTLFFILISAYCFAQDYYLTPNKNKTPLQVKSAADITNVLKQQNKDKKYRVVVLYSDAKEAVYILVPASLNVNLSDNDFIINNYDSESETENPPANAFDINVSFKDAPEDMEQNFKQLAKEEQKKIAHERSEKVYGRNKFEKFAFGIENYNITVLTAPYAGKFVELVYMVQTDKSGSSAVNKKGEAALGIAAASLNRAVFTANPEVPYTEDSSEDILKEEVPPVLENFTSDKVSASQTAYKLDIKQGEDTYSYTFTLPSSVTVKQDNSSDIRLIIDKTANSEMWFELVYKNSKQYNDTALAQYAAGKKLNKAKKTKFKAGQKTVTFVKKTALNVNASSYFFNIGDKKFVLSFIAPSAKLPAYEQNAAALLRSFKAVKK